MVETIFLRAAKKLITKCLDKSMAEASAADLSWRGGFRNKELSNKQKDLTIKLRGKINNLSGTSDEENLTSLKKDIIDIEAQVTAVRTHHNEGRKTLNSTLTKINADLDRFYSDLKRLSYNLIDIPYDQDSFSLLCYQATYYFGENIFIPVEENTLIKAFKDFSGMSSIDIRAKKEHCLLEHLASLAKKLDAIKEDHVDARIDCVIKEIEAIQRGNAKICIDSQITGTLPISINVAATVNVSTSPVKPSRGRLEIRMQKAIEKIHKVATQHEVEHTISP